MTRTATGGGAEGSALAYDGAQTTGITTTGTAAGAYTFGYDDNGFLTSSKLVSGAQTVTSAITRDKDGLVTADGPFAIARGGAGGTASAITGAGLTMALGRDDVGGLESRTLTVGANQRYKVAITRSDDGRISRRTETVDGVAHTYDYRYDDDGRLLEVERDAGTAQAAIVERYTYDANGNRKSRRLDGGAVETATFDDEDRLTARGTTAYAYDGAGFLTERGADRFDYSARGELLSATVGATTVTYRYDALGRRVARVQGAQITQYLYGDPSNPVRVTATRSAGRGAHDLPLRRRRPAVRVRARRPAVLRRHRPGRHAARRDRRRRRGRRRARPTTRSATCVSDSAPAFDLPIGYAGGLEDRVTGLVRFGFRDHDTASGRWTARDPALYDGGQANLYSYVGGDPVSLRDPLGLWCAGGSVYDGVGGGATLCNTDEGWAVCFEVGFGFGWAVGLDNAQAAEGRRVDHRRGQGQHPRLRGRHRRRAQQLRRGRDHRLDRRDRRQRQCRRRHAAAREPRRWRRGPRRRSRRRCAAGSAASRGETTRRRPRGRRAGLCQSLRDGFLDALGLEGLDDEVAGAELDRLEHLGLLTQRGAHDHARARIELDDLLAGRRGRPSRAS